MHAGHGRLRFILTVSRVALFLLQRCFARCLRVLDRVFLAIFTFIVPEGRQPPSRANRVSPAENPLLLLSAVQLARRIQRRRNILFYPVRCTSLLVDTLSSQVSCVEVIQASISRIEEGSLLVNALVKDRLMMSALHFNENASREQAVTQSGEARYKIDFPKFRRGEHTVKKIMVPRKCSFS
ncbi:Fatty-acid amide hydrolase 2-A [Acipenser ruthenus]|uniref:Fatty-acid amide hydrolase 2-A n=1 Tax=Acipenser ruthenus TaxID=7906 RepID=A0A444U372_ACIRT|nr:Fatty-acid amide hydrolase 2-A [Acipenser ruthenus]